MGNISGSHGKRGIASASGGISNTYTVVQGPLVVPPTIEVAPLASVVSEVR